MLVKGNKPPPGFTPIPGSRVGGWHRPKGAKWEYWYPPGVDKTFEEHGSKDVGGYVWSELKKTLKVADTDLWALLIQGDKTNALPISMRRDALVHAKRKQAGIEAPKLDVLGDADGKQFSHAELDGKQFYNVDHPDLRYHVIDNGDGTFAIEKTNGSSPDLDPEHVDKVPSNIMQALMSRWREKKPGVAAEDHADADGLGHAWSGEHRVFDNGPEAAEQADLFERLDLSSAKGRVQALKALKKKMAAEANAMTAAGNHAGAAALNAKVVQIDKDIKALQAYEAAFTAFNKQRLGAVKAALDAKNAASTYKTALDRSEVFQAESTFFRSANGRALIKQLSGQRFDTDKLWSAYKDNLPSGTVIADNTPELASISDQASAFAADGPMTRGKDGALYTSETWGVPDLTLAHKEELAKAFVRLKKNFKKMDAMDVKQEIAKGNPACGKTPAEIKAFSDVVNSIAALKGGATTAIHYPEAASLDPGLYTRYQAILTTLATRRPPPLPVANDFTYRGVVISNAAVAGLHAGLTMSMNSGCSSSLKEFVGGVSPLHPTNATYVTYVWPKAECGIDAHDVLGYSTEEEVIQAGTFAIESITTISGGGTPPDVAKQFGSGFGYKNGYQKRLMVKLRALTPQELQGLNIQHGGLRVELVKAGRDIQAEVWTADVVEHAAQKAARYAAKPTAMSIAKGGWASKSEALQAQKNANAEVERRGGTVLKDPFSKIAELPIETQLKRTVAVFNEQGYNQGTLGRRVEVDLRGGRYKRALDTMRGAMDGKTPPEGFTPDGKNAGVYVKMENGKATAYWKAGKLMTPAEYAKEYMGDFDNSTKIKASAIEYADRIEKGDGAKPPAGFSPIPGSKKGGYHKRSGEHYETWYPKHGVTKGRATTHQFNQGPAHMIHFEHEANDKHAVVAVRDYGSHKDAGIKLHTGVDNAARKSISFDSKKKEVEAVRKKTQHTESSHETLGEAMDAAHEHLHTPTADKTQKGAGGDIGHKPGEPIVKSDAVVDAAWLGALARDEARNAVRWGIYPLTANGDDSTLARAAADRVVARMLGDGDSDESGAAKRLTRCIAASGADCVYNAILSEMPGMRLAHPPESKGNNGIPILDGVTLDDAFSVNGGGGF